MKRFYKLVAVGEYFSVLLDGKPILTPARAPLALPTGALAQAIAEEWRAQTQTIDPETMPLTKLANTVIDGVARNRAAVIEQTCAIGRSDHLCYRAEEPAVLMARQAALWDPLLDWAWARYGARLKTGQGIGFVEQPVDALAALDAAVASFDDFALAALHSAAALSGSLVLALALAEGRLDATQAFEASQLDERFQAERWGRDGEAERRRGHLLAELHAAERFLRLLKLG
jgi:chaperone required for assembly of F1-ATPase